MDVTRMLAISVLTVGCRGGDSKPEPVPPAGRSAVASDAAPTIDAAMPDSTATITFDSDAIDKAPPGFTSLRTGPGRLGRWQVLKAADAPSPPHVVAQLDPDRTDARFPLLVADSPGFRGASAADQLRPAVSHRAGL